MTTPIESSNEREEARLDLLGQKFMATEISVEDFTRATFGERVETPAQFETAVNRLHDEADARRETEAEEAL